MIDSKPVRIAQIMGKLWAGGVEMVVFNYYREIDKSKIQFDFFYDEDSTVEPSQELISMGARFYKLPPYQRLSEYLKVLRKYLKENKYIIIHSHINTLSIFPLFVAWLENIPIRIAHNHSVPGGNEFTRNIIKKMLKFFSKVFSTDYFACSEKAGRWMFGNKTFEDGKVYILKNAVNWELFNINKKQIESLKKQLGLCDKFVIGHIGRFTYAKNHNFMIDILYEVLKKKENAVLLLVGDGDMYKRIISHINAMGLSDKVVLTGQVANPQEYYKLIDVMIVPSIFEGLSLTTIESQISGVPVLMSYSVPREAVISNGCRYMKLSEPPQVWAENVINMYGIQVKLKPESKDYNIHKAVISLSRWYLDKVKYRLEIDKT